MSTSGPAAGATIEVWKAWLTGIWMARMPSSVNLAIAPSTGSVLPPMTAWLLELMLATTT